MIICYSIAISRVKKMETTKNITTSYSKMFVVINRELSAEGRHREKN